MHSNRQTIVFMHRSLSCKPMNFLHFSCRETTWWYTIFNVVQNKPTNTHKVHYHLRKHRHEIAIITFVFFSSTEQITKPERYLWSSNEESKQLAWPCNRRVTNANSNSCTVLPQTERFLGWIDFKILRRFDSISVISRLGRRGYPISEIVETRPGFERFGTSDPLL